MHVTIRPAYACDGPPCADIYRPIVADTIISFEETPPDGAAMGARIENTRATHPWLCASDESGIVGYAYASPHRERAGYRYSVNVSVYVAAHVRGKSVGTRLYQALFAELEKAGFHRAFAGVTLPNDASVALHTKLGFSVVGTYHEVGYKFGKWLDVMWLERSI